MEFQPTRCVSYRTYETVRVTEPVTEEYVSRTVQRRF